MQTTKDLPNTKQSSQPMISPFTHHRRKVLRFFLYCLKNKYKRWQKNYTWCIPSPTVPQNGLCDTKGLIADFNYTQVTLMGVNTAAISITTMSTLAEHQLGNPCQCYLYRDCFVCSFYSDFTKFCCICRALQKTCETEEL